MSRIQRMEELGLRVAPASRSLTRLITMHPSLSTDVVGWHQAFSQTTFSFQLKLATVTQFPLHQTHPAVSFTALSRTRPSPLVRSLAKARMALIPSSTGAPVGTTLYNSAQLPWPAACNPLSLSFTPNRADRQVTGSLGKRNFCK